MIITDISDTAFTYSFTTLKPAISFIPFKYSEKSSIGGFNREYRHNIGYVSRTLTELKNNIDAILKNSKKFRANIRDTRDSLVFNIERSGDYLIENIDFILNNKKHPEWIYF
jgi:predicted DNA binding protein